MIYRAPDFVQNFKCAAADCRDSCCIGWEIAVDRETMKKYGQLSADLGEQIRKSLTEDGIFRLSADGRCPHLLDSGLCRLICEGGEDLLCEICREHPRFYNTEGALCEWGLSLACETAAELILTAPLPYTFKESEKCEPCEPADEHLLSLLLAERERVLSMIADEKNEENKLLHFLKDFAKALQHYADNADFCKDKFAFFYKEGEKEPFFDEEKFEEYKSILLSLEPLSDRWPLRCAAMRYEEMLCIDGALFRKLLSYYIYRYMLPAAQDGDIEGRIGLCIFCAALTALLCKCEGRTDISSMAEAAKDFSKEVECSEENLATVQDAFSAFGEKGIF